MEVMEVVAQLMALSARTAPKAGGKDYIVTKIVTGEDLERLADAMIDYGKQTGKINFDRDADNIRRSQALLLIGLRAPATAGLNCGACGFARCQDLEEAASPQMVEFPGPWCAWRIIDLGIALGSAAKMASLLNADNRIMYRAGVVAKRIGLVSANLVCGIPISATGKSIYFDRG